MGTDTTASTSVFTTQACLIKTLVLTVVPTYYVHSNKTIAGLCARSKSRLTRQDKFVFIQNILYLLVASYYQLNTLIYVLITCYFDNKHYYTRMGRAGIVYLNSKLIYAIIIDRAIILHIEQRDITLIQ